MKIDEIMEKIKDFLVKSVVYIDAPVSDKPWEGAELVGAMLRLKDPRPMFKYKIKNKDMFLKSVNSYLEDALKSLTAFSKHAPLKTKKGLELLMEEDTHSLKVFGKKGKTKLTVLELRQVRSSFRRPKVKFRVKLLVPVK